MHFSPDNRYIVVEPGMTNQQVQEITGAGKEIRTGVYTSKGVVDYDLTRMIVGSQGILNPDKCCRRFNGSIRAFFRHCEAKIKAMYVHDTVVYYVQKCST